MKYIVSAVLSIHASNTLDALETFKTLDFYYYDRLLGTVVDEVSNEKLIMMQEENKKNLESNGNWVRYVLKVISDPIEKFEAFTIFDILDRNVHTIIYPTIAPSPIT